MLSITVLPAPLEVISIEAEVVIIAVIYINAGQRLKNEEKENRAGGQDDEI